MVMLQSTFFKRLAPASCFSLVCRHAFLFQLACRAEEQYYLALHAGLFAQTVDATLNLLILLKVADEREPSPAEAPAVCHL